ncbi:sigma 54-interacting transcriptional regulator [candidate division WOR-3 bacterium]|nr:sigma 54-interacting transcriptional regulator [candidate division WOR-3 bacterium]
MAKADVKAEAELAALEQELAAAAPGAGRLEVLVRMGRILFINRPDRCRSVLEDALVESQRCGDNAALASAVQMLAELAFQRGDSVESERLVERALATARAVGNRRAESGALNLRGSLYEARGEYEEARSHYQQALDVSRESGYREGEQAALNQLGALAGLQGRPEEALEFLKRCLEIDDQLGDDYLRTVHLYNTGWALENLGRMDEAAEYCYRAIALAETAGYPEIKIDATSMLGEFYLKRDRPDKAVELLGRVVDGLKQQNDRKGLLRDALANYGTARLRLGDLSHAEEVFREALALAEESKDQHSLAVACWRMAELALALGDLDRAEGLVGRASAVAHEAGLTREQGEALRVRSMVLARQGDAAAARDAAERSIAEFERLGDGYELARARLQLGQLLADSGERQAALRVLAAAAATFRRLSVVGESEQANRLIFRLEMPESGTAALIGGLAGLARIGLEPHILVERALKLLCEGARFCSGAVLAGGAVLAQEGRPAVERALKLLRRGEVEGAGWLAVRLEAGDADAWVYLERAAGDDGYVPRALTDEIASRFSEPVRKLRELAVVPAGQEAIPGLKYRGLVGRNPAMLENLRIVSRVASTTVPVLIRGESGTGKEFVARALHESGERRAGRFVAVNCAAVPEGLLEAEFFGVVKGAATGVSARAGKFEAASGGTIFLDEIGDMSVSLQSKLLRVLQEGMFEPLGGDRPVKVDIRLVAATNQDLGDLMAQGRFRNDLYYRLNTVELVLPPLRDRAEDIPELVRHFITRSNQEFGRSVLGASDEAMSLLLAYKWPGNIRELQHLVERAVLLVSGPVIGAENLPAELQALGAQPGHQGTAVRRSARRRPDGQGAGGSERAMLVDCLERAGWNVSEAAVLAGYSRAQFYRLLKKHQVARPDQS